MESRVFKRVGEESKLNQEEAEPTQARYLVFFADLDKLQRLEITFTHLP